MGLTVGLLGLAALSSGSSIPLSVFRRFVGSQARDLSVGGGWWWAHLKATRVLYSSCLDAWVGE